MKTYTDSLCVTFADVESAAKQIEGVAHRTPSRTSRTFDELTGCTAYFKCENFQRIGAFKFRGAYNALSRLREEQRARGVLTFSSGNHAQAIALAGKLLGIQTTIVMPSTAPRVKLAATRGYGAEVIEYEISEIAREELGAKLAAERGLTVIPPFDHPHIIAGQGTAVKELIEDVGPLDLLVVPTGGAGLLAGSALAAKAMCPACEVVGVEPEAGDDLCQSFAEGRIVTIDVPDTIADGARTPRTGDHNWEILQALVDRMITAPDEALVRLMKFFAERMKMIVEPTGCLGAAAVRDGALDVEGKRVGIVLTGGNVDLMRMFELISAQESALEAAS